MEIKWTQLNPNAKIPKPIGKTKTYFLRTLEPIDLSPHSFCVVFTGLSLEFPETITCHTTTYNRCCGNEEFIFVINGNGELSSSSKEVKITIGNFSNSRIKIKAGSPVAKIVFD